MSHLSVMVQILYTITAIFVLGITVLTLNVKIHSTQHRLVLSELSLEMTSVGAEVLNEAGRLAYDPSTVFGEMPPRATLSSEASWGSSLCDPDARFRGCVSIHDLHGATAQRTLARTYEGRSVDVVYDVTDIEVAYVSEAAPHTPTGGAKSYAKEVRLRVSTPSLVDADGAPLQVPMARVYTTPRF